MRTILKLKFKNKSSKRIMKKLLGFVILFGLGTMLFGSNQNNVYAQVESDTVAEQQYKKMSDSNQMMNSILKFIYALLWPVLFVAGIALDNTLVYGSFLHLDASLWSLWNIMKNFANFALGFMVLFSIVRSIFTLTSGNSDKWSPIKIIKKTLIAGILIQMSWFLMAATIDVSTILTYSIGGLPMTVLQNNPETKNTPIMGINAKMHVGSEDDSKMNIDYYGTYGDHDVSLCHTSSKISGLTGNYIVGRKKIKIDDETYFKTGYCMLGAWPYHYKEFLPNLENMSENEGYMNALKSYLSVLTGENAEQHLINFEFLEIGTSTGGWGAIGHKDTFFTEAGSQTTLDSLLEKSKGFVGPFITIYSSLLDFSTLTETPDTTEGITSNFFELMIKVLFAVALFFPLVALAIVLLARIGILRLSIISSPVIVLLATFKEDLGLNKMDGMMTYFDIKNLISLIFAPVFVVFAISMSMIFLSALKPNHVEGGTNNNYLESMGVEKNGDSYNVGGLIDINLDFMGDQFAWIITNLFAVGIIWFFLFAAIKMTEIGKSVGDTMKGGVEKMLGNLPIIPIGSGVGVNTVAKGLENAETNINSAMLKGQDQELKKYMPWLYGEAAEDENKKVSSGDQQIAWANYGKANSIYAAAIARGDKNMTIDNAFSEAGVTEAQKEFISATDSTYITQFNDYSSVLGVKGVENNETANITTFDASKYDAGTIKSMVDKGGAWQEWAKGVVGGNVKTNGSTMVMVNAGTHSSPDFKLVSQDVYAKDYLGQKGDGKVNIDQAKQSIENKIKSQYNLGGNATSEQLSEQQQHIDAQQKEIADRLVLLERKEQGGSNTETTANTET